MYCICFRYQYKMKTLPSSKSVQLLFEIVSHRKTFKQVEI